VSEPSERGRTHAAFVLVITAWHEDGAVRARVIDDATGVRHSVTCRSLQDLLTTVQSAIVAWDAGIR
jgi:hypothetical protein